MAANSGTHSNADRIRFRAPGLLAFSIGAGALSGLLFGFDTAVIAGVTGDLTHAFALSPTGLGIAVSAALWGTLLGAAGAGPLGDRYGSRALLCVTALFYVISALSSALCWSLESFVIARAIGGLAIGASSVLAPVYIAEIAPAKRRGRLVGLFQLSIVAGILMAYLSNGIVAVAIADPEAWRWKLGVALAPAAVLLALMSFAPNSPRWLASRGRQVEAERVAARLGIALQQSSAETSGQREATGLSWRAHRRPIALAMALAVFNQLTGINAVLYYLNDIFAAAGFSQMSADAQAVAIGFVNLLATLAGMALIDRLGRKPLLELGAVGMFLALTLVGVVQSGLASPALLLPALILFIASFALSQGAVIWVYLSEIFPQPVRAQGAAIGAGVHWLMNAVIAALFPVIAAESRGGPFFLFAAAMAAQFLAVRLFFPETRGLSLERTATLTSQDIST
jgi:sugar porter (SP) family MFS transporter